MTLSTFDLTLALEHDAAARLRDEEAAAAQRAIDKSRNGGAAQAAQYKGLGHQIHSLEGLCVILSRETERMERGRDHLLKGLRDQYPQPTAAEVKAQLASVEGARVLRLSDAEGVFGGWTSNRDQSRLFHTLMDYYVHRGAWCCSSRNQARQDDGRVYVRPPPPLKNKLRLWCWELVQSAKFNNFILFVILFNMCVMALDGYDIPLIEEEILSSMDDVCIAIYTAEAALKVTGYGFIEYLHDAWNVFEKTG